MPNVYPVNEVTRLYIIQWKPQSAIPESSHWLHTWAHTAARAIGTSDREQGLFADSEDKHTFYFCSTTSSNDMLMSAFSMSHLLRCNKAKKHTILNCVKIDQKASETNRCTINTAEEEGGGQSEKEDKQNESKQFFFSLHFGIFV